MRVLGNSFLAHLYHDAERSPRKRTHLNLHTSYNDKVQRLLIALSKGSYVEPHYHHLPHQWEMFIILEGVIEVTLYSTTGSVIKETLIGDGYDDSLVEFEPNDIHSVKCISDQALLLEIKEGPFAPSLAKQFPSWN